MRKPCSYWVCDLLAMSMWPGTEEEGLKHIQLLHLDFRLVVMLVLPSWTNSFIYS